MVFTATSKSAMMRKLWLIVATVTEKCIHVSSKENKGPFTLFAINCGNEIVLVFLQNR